MTIHSVFVCKTCATTRIEGKPQGKSGGQQLLEAIADLVPDWELRQDMEIQEVECMSACNRSCVVSFAAAGKYTYLFGDLPIQECASAVLECAGLYFRSQDGYLPWSERPEALKKGILARIPPLPQADGF